MSLLYTKIQRFTNEFVLSFEPPLSRESNGQYWTIGSDVEPLVNVGRSSYVLEYIIELLQIIDEAILAGHKIVPVHITYWTTDNAAGIWTITNSAVTIVETHLDGQVEIEKYSLGIDVDKTIFDLRENGRKSLALIGK